MKVLRIVLVAMAFISLQAHAEDASTRNAADDTFEQTDDSANFDELERLARKGDSDAQGKLAHMYFVGQGVTKDYAKSMMWAHKAAKQGNANAQNFLDLVYTNGLPGVAKDDKWHHKAAELGFASAQFKLGAMYEKGEGVPRDDARAVEWWQKAAVRGYADAQYSLGVMYSNGRGVPRDETKGVEWYQKAAELGNIDAQNLLGQVYANGLLGVKKDWVEAAKWYLKAAESGNAGAQFKLGEMYEKGEGVPKDDTKAVEWWQKAAVQGNEDAQYNLGVMYSNGKGVPKDTAKAMEWYQMAAKPGNAATRELQRMEGELPRNGKVLSRIDASPYTYIELTENGMVIWIAAPAMKVQEGDTVRFSDGAAMSNFFSAKLNRTFEAVTFVGNAEAEGRQKQVARPDVVAMVRIPGKNYEIGKFKVTQSEWREVIGNNPSGFPNCGDNCPVENVSWNDVQEFIQKLNAKTGKKYRLPTEDEWEYACYGGNQSEYCGGNNIDAVAWYRGNSDSQPHAVGQKQANGYGLYDMSGNVWEWTNDCWKGDCENRVLRGGSWNYDPQYVRASYRFGNGTEHWNDFSGVRLARTLF